MKKTIKFKLEDVIIIYMALSKLANKEFKEFSQGYWFSRWFSQPLKKIENEFNNIQAGLRALVRTHGEKVGDGKASKYTIFEYSKNYKKYKKELDEYMKIEIELEFDHESPKLSQLETMHYNFTSIEFFAIMPFIEDDPQNIENNPIQELNKSPN